MNTKLNLNEVSNSSKKIPDPLCGIDFLKNEPISSALNFINPERHHGDFKLKIIFAEIQKLIFYRMEGVYDLDYLVDEHLLRKVLLGLILMPDRIGTYYLVEAVIVCKYLLIDNSVVVVGEVYKCVAEKFNVSPEAVEKSIRKTMKVLWETYRCGSKDPVVYDYIFPSIYSSPTNKEIITFMAMNVLGIQNFLEAVTA